MFPQITLVLFLWQLHIELLHQQDVSKHVTAAARFAANDLPDFIDECKVVYLPEMGHLMVIKKWEPDCDPEQLESLGYQFMVLKNSTTFFHLNNLNFSLRLVECSITRILFA